VLARLLGLRFGCAAGATAFALLFAVTGVASTGGGRASVCTVDGETGVAGPLEPSTDDCGDWGAGEAEGDAVGSVKAIVRAVYVLEKDWSMSVCDQKRRLVVLV
jgi:hypothetical protein